MLQPSLLSPVRIPAAYELRQLTTHFQDLQAAQTVTDLNIWRNRLLLTTPHWLVSYRLRPASTRHDVQGLVPLWAYPNSARVEFESPQDFIIRLANGVRARWDFHQQRWESASFLEAAWREWRQPQSLSPSLTARA